MPAIDCTTLTFYVSRFTPERSLTCSKMPCYGAMIFGQSFNGGGIRGGTIDRRQSLGIASA
jgi:hypothetical protein